jgi:FG-GAP-like repeat
MQLSRCASPFRRTAIASLALVIAAPAASAQFNIQWLTLTQSTSKFKTPAGADADIVTNGDEKDFAIADVNKDGWDDVAVGKKIQVSFPGKREGRFFLNEKGVLVDRTAQYAAASTTSGDNGFKEPLDCRDVEFADLNGDSWLDILSTQTDLSNDTSTGAKRTTHPRVYVSLGTDGNGNWLGFRHEDNRIPQLKTIPGNINGIVRFCDGAVGDVDADGDLDLYFVDYDTDENGHSEPSANDLNDRLLLNDGSGFFTDATNSNFNNSGMWSSAFGTECEIIDMNGDGRLDIVKISTLTDSPNRNEVIYNNLSPTTTPNFTGGYDNIANISTGENYNFANADINNDGKIDHLVGDDAVDHYVFNTGNNALGQVVWTAGINYTWLTGSGDDGFPGQMYARDYNLDGWMDCLITDVDIDLPGCNRRTKIYHNRGGTPGATNIILAEEKQQSGTGGWFGANGWTVNNPKGVNDAGNLDLDHDGDIDILLGMCTGTQVWLNGTNPVVCQTSVSAASLGNGAITVCGAPLWSNLSSTMTITGGPNNGVALLLAAFHQNTLPLFGGQVLVPFSLAVPITLNGTGGATITVNGGAGTKDGLFLYVQAILATAGGASVTDITNVVRLDLRS